VELARCRGGVVFDPVVVIPACWPQHAHLVHELAVLADRRRSADLGLASELLEEWHRFALLAFLDRMRHRVGDHCTDDHAAVWPSPPPSRRPVHGIPATGVRYRHCREQWRPACE
jgi:hypothetical protein